MITNHDPIVPECEGCMRIFREINGEKRLICRWCAFPKMQWIGGFACSGCTTIEHKPSEDPEEEGKYDFRRR